jgi:hypothetical protein
VRRRLQCSSMFPQQEGPKERSPHSANWAACYSVLQSIFSLARLLEGALKRGETTWLFWIKHYPLWNRRCWRARNVIETVGCPLKACGPETRPERAATPFYRNQARGGPESRLLGAASPVLRAGKDLARALPGRGERACQPCGSSRSVESAAVAPDLVRS